LNRQDAKVAKAACPPRAQLAVLETPCLWKEGLRPASLQSALAVLAVNLLFRALSVFSVVQF
jgi:hypothetical protein